MNAIKVDNLVVEIEKKKILNGLSLVVDKGKIFGFLGPNGAGKSTTIKSLLGLLTPSSGSVQICGASPSSPATRQKIGFLPEEAFYYRYLTAYETLEFYGKLCGIQAKILDRRIEELLNLVGLWSVKDKTLKTFSKGMTQKVSLLQALINDPEILILDEPTSGLDPIARLELRKILVSLRDRGKTIFFSSHELSEVELICDELAIIKSGKIIQSGSLKQVMALAGEKTLENFFIHIVCESVS